jgi:flagellin
MSMVIGTNVASLTAQRHLASSRADMETAMERLSSGKRINSAMDDAAGLAVANKLESKVTGLNQSVRNANDGISMLQTAEGALEEVSSILIRMKEIATQASNGTYASTDLTAMNTEFTALATEITRISDETDFNTVVVTGATSTINFQVGDSNSSNDQVSITLQDMAATAIGGTVGAADHISTQTLTTAASSTAAQVSVQTMATSSVASGDTLTFEIEGTVYTQAFDTDNATTATKLAAQITAGSPTVAVVATVASSNNIFTITAQANNDLITQGIVSSSSTSTTLNSQTVSTLAAANLAMTSVDAAIASVDSYRGTIGSVANTLNHSVANLMNRSENQSAAISRIEDTDYAVESANLAKTQVLQQAGTAMLAQANASGQSVLSLLK